MWECGGTLGAGARAAAGRGKKSKGARWKMKRGRRPGRSLSPLSLHFSMRPARPHPRAPTLPVGRTLPAAPLRHRALPPQAPGGTKDASPPPAPSPSSSTTPPPPVTTLFSNLGPDLRHAPGSTAGAAALVAGTAVGAGILALPAVTAPAGFLPSAAGLAAAWAFSVASGLLLAETNVNTLCALGRGGASLRAMAGATLGRAGAGVTGLAYAFLHGALLVAYCSRAGEVLEGGAGLPYPAGAALFLGGVGGVCALFSPAALDAANGAFVAAVVGTFLALCGSAVATGGPPSTDALFSAAAQHPAALLPAAPVLALAFVFQNVVPVIVTQLEGDRAKVRTAIVAGSALPFLLFITWEGVCLGAGGAGGAGAAAALTDPLAALRLASPATAPLIDAFSLLAVGTSAIGFTLALTDFAGEALNQPARSLGPYAATLLPPLAGALAAPGIFLGALNAAGTYGVLVLFGLLPPAMAAIDRARWAKAAADEGGPVPPARLLGGGSAGLLAVGGTAAVVIVGETWRAVSGGGV